MLAQRGVNYSRFPAELNVRSWRPSCNGWLQCEAMRIELPPATWADATPRVDDDAHTLTLAAQPAPEWALPHGEPDAALRLRMEVAPTTPVTVTLTF